MPDQLQFSPGSCDPGLCLLLKSMEDVNRVPDLRDINRSIRAARIVGAHLPNGFGKTAQDPGAFVLLSDLSLIESESQSLPNDGREARQAGRASPRARSACGVWSAPPSQDPLYAKSGINPLWRTVETGFDSGSTLDYVYRNRPSGITPIGRLIDWSYLNAIGWRERYRVTMITNPGSCAGGPRRNWTNWSKRQGFGRRNNSPTIGAFSQSRWLKGSALDRDSSRDSNGRAAPVDALPPLACGADTVLLPYVRVCQLGQQSAP